MPSRTRFSPLLHACAWLVLLICTRAHALQPLETFLAGARHANHDNREAAATAVQSRAAHDVAQGRLYPGFTAAGSYTRNQYEVAFNVPAEGGAPGARLVIQPRNQLDAALTLSVPVIDVGAWRRVSAASASADAAKAGAQATERDVETQVFRGYYQLLGQEAVLDAAGRTLEVLRKNLESVQIKLGSGTASELDVQRGRAEIARAEGDVAAADLAVVTARRRLATMTSIEPEPAKEFLSDDLHSEAPLETWLRSSMNTPRVIAAAALQQAAQRSAAAAEAAWFPTLAASAQERLTNATSFSGHQAVYLLQATLTFHLDASVPASVRAERAAAEISAIRAERAQRNTEDAIFEAWHEVRVAIEKSRAARAQIAASQLAAELARDRYSVGAATQLEVLQAQQDAFAAEVARVQADTELAYARAALRASAGRFDERNEP